MKNAHIIIGAALAAVLLPASCSEEYDYRKKVSLDTPAKVALRVVDLEDTVALMAPRTKSYVVKAEAAAISDGVLTLSVHADLSKVAAYNREHGTSFEPVPGDAYELSSHQLLLPRYNTVSSTLQLTLRSQSRPEDGATCLLPLCIDQIEGSDKLDLSARDSTVFILFRRKPLPESGFELGTGTESDPFVIRNIGEMVGMAHALKSGGTTYFKMEEDVDMSDYEDWVPLNAVPPYDKAVDFDGNGHRIIGFNCTADAYPSLFGVFLGSFRNTVFDAPVLEVGAASAGLLAARPGGAEMPAQVSGVTVNGLVIHSRGTVAGIGGLVGHAVNSSFSDITVDLRVEDADHDDRMPNAVGGIAGTCSESASTFTDCRTTGFLTGNAQVGGLVGYIQAVEGIIVERCTSAVDIESFGQNAGGLLGYAAGERMTVRDCDATGAVSGGGHYTGGLIGSMAGNSTVLRCSASGNVTSRAGNHVGGLIGNACRSAGDVLIEDCFASGDVSVVSGQRMAGGLIAVVENRTGVTVRRCFASGRVTSGWSQAGGLMAIAKLATLTDSMEFTLEHSVAWNPAVLTQSLSGNWSSGGIIGVSNVTNRLSGNYRRPDMEFYDRPGWDLFDQADVSPTAPLEGYDASLYYYPYHGKAAPSGATLSSVARSLGWPESVWDLSGDVPAFQPLSQRPR